MRPDVVFITNPTSKHIPVALLAAKNGCDIFIEKPISNNMNNLQKLRKLVQKKKLITYVACQFRFHPLILKIKKMIKSSSIGEIVYARAEWSEYLPEWHPWENYRIGYSARKDLGGGVILTQVHPIDYLYWFFGKIKSVKSIYAHNSDLKMNVEDLAEIILRFKNGIIGSVHVDYIQRPRVHQMTIVGLEGRIFWDCHARKMLVTYVNGKTKIYRDPLGFVRNSMFIDEVKHFMECVKKRKNTINTLDQGIDVLEVALKAKQ
jgi:predicted dehydrogenase